MDFQTKVSLKNYNTFGIDVTADFVAVVSSENDYRELLKTDVYLENKHLILGGGSNVLLIDDFEGLVVRNEIKGIEINKETNDHVWITAGSGEIWHELVLYCLKNDWGGIENLSLIPGTLGAAPMQNIGAYGVELKEVFDHLTAIDAKTGEKRIFRKEDCKFGYRESVFKNKYKDQYFISAVTLQLTKQNHRLNTSYGAIIEQLNGSEPTIQSISDAVIQIRRSKLPDPREIGNSGSFFKNPEIDKIDFEGLKAEFPNIPGYDLGNNRVKVPAGWLIEQAGWKGKKTGNVGVHEKQALVLVNYGVGKGKEIKELALAIQDSISDKFGVILQPEVNFIS